jgi:acetyl-CoA carboxylase biotin carboxyl carrier protein
VKKGQTLCILEAMKLMNEFQAEFDLQIVNILVENGKMVEFGMPLFEVRRV